MLRVNSSTIRNRSQQKATNLLKENWMDFLYQAKEFKSGNLKIYKTL